MRLINNYRQFGWRMEVSEMGAVPTGYGFCWRVWDRAVHVAMPIPINQIASVLHALWIWSIQPHVNDKFYEAYEKGYKDGQDNKSIQLKRVYDLLYAEQDTTKVLRREIAQGLMHEAGREVIRQLREPN